MLSLAGLLAMEEGERDPVGTHQTGAVIVQGERLRLRRTVATQPPLHPGGSLGNWIMPGPAGVGADLTVRVERRVDDVRPAGPDGLVADPQPVGDTLPEVLDHHIGVLNQPPEDFQAG